MMFKFYFKIILLLLFLIILVGCSKRGVESGKSIQPVIISTQEVEKEHNQLSVEQTKSLKKLLKQNIAWHAEWAPYLICPGIDKTDDEMRSWVNLFNDSRDEKIEIFLEEPKEFFYVYIPKLKIRAEFKLYEDKTLSFLDLEAICSVQKNDFYRNLRKLSIDLRYSSNEDVDKKAKMKRELLWDIAKTTTDTYCGYITTHSKRLMKINIPDFDVGNQNIYVRIESKNEILYIWFNFIYKDGKYNSIKVKAFGLPDERKKLEKIFRKHKFFYAEMYCSDD